MNYRTTTRLFGITILLLCLWSDVYSQTTAASAPEKFPTPQAAADALVAAAGKFDVPALEGIFGPEGEDIIHSGEPARDQEIAKQFAEQARKDMKVSVDPKTKRRAFISIGDE